MFSFIIGLTILKLTGSGLSFAGSLIFNILPVILFGPAAGFTADRFSRKKIITICNLLNSIWFFIISFAISESPNKIWLCYTTIFVTSTITTFFDIAMTSAIPQLTNENKFPVYNAFSHGISAFSGIICPIIGGILFSHFDINKFAFFTGICFLVSAFSYFFLQFAPFKYIDKNSSDLKSAVNIIKNKLFWTVAILLLINFFTAICFSVPMPVIFNKTLKFSSKIYGYLQALTPIGVLIGSVIVTKVKFEYTLILRISAISFCMLFLLFTVPLWIPFAFNIMLIWYGFILLTMGIVIAFFDIPLLGWLQNLCPENLIGKVLSLVMSAIKIANPISLFLAGILIDTISPLNLVLSGSVGLFAGISLIAILSKNKKSSRNNLEIFSESNILR